MAKTKELLSGYDHRIRKTAGGNNVSEYLATCSECGKERWVRRGLVDSLCRGCDAKSRSQKRNEGKDYIYVTHKAKDRKSQNVKKFKSICPSCSKDKGYVFKSSLGKDCSSCVKKKSFQNGAKINSNNNGLRSYHVTPNQGTVCVRSSYGSFYLEYLNSSRTNYFYEPKTFVFKDGTTYLPDFYMPDKDAYVELKGLMDPTSALKIDKMKQEYPSVILNVLRLEDLKKLGYSQRDYRDRFTININGEKWMVQILSNKAYTKLIGKDSCALTNVLEKKLFFTMESSLDIDTVTHEVGHAYFSNLCLDSTTELKLSDFEEINCEFLARNCGKIIATSSMVYKHALDIAQKRYKQKVEMKYFNMDVTVDDLKGINRFAKLLDRILSFPENQDLVKLFTFVLMNKLDNIELS